MKAKKLKKEVDKTIKYLCKKVRDDNYMCDYKDSMTRKQKDTQSRKYCQRQWIYTDPWTTTSENREL